MRYGIPQHILNVDCNGEFDKVNFLASIEERRAFEERQKNQIESAYLPFETSVPRRVESGNVMGTQSSRGCTVTSNDVLIGKGGYRQRHPANARLSQLIEMNRADYASASKLEKTVISMSIVRTVKESKARFLKRPDRNSDEWVEISDLEARQAVSHRLRNKPPRQIKKPIFSLLEEEEAVPDMAIDEGHRKRVKG